MSRELEQQKRVLRRVHGAITTGSIGTTTQFSDVFRVLHKEGKIPAADLAAAVRNTETTMLSWVEGNDVPEDPREWAWIMKAVAEFINGTLHEWEVSPKKH